MGAHFLVFIGVSAIVILIPGPDTAVVTKNVLAHGRRAALGTSLGVSAGLSVWTVAAAAGIASVLRASAVAFTVLKLIGALGGFRQGLVSDLTNPKIGIFFTSLLPQFVDPGHPVLLPFLALGAVFVLMTMLWLSVCASRQSIASSRAGWA